MIDQVCIAQGQSVDTLLEQSLERVIATGLAAGIPQGPGDGSRQPHCLINLSQEWETAITRNVTAGKIGFNFAAFNGWK